MVKAEKLKVTLKFNFEQEYKAWKSEEESKKKALEEEERGRKEREERDRRDELGKQYRDEKEKSLAEQKDHQTALFYQMQADKEYEEEQLEAAIRLSKMQDPEEDASSSTSGGPGPAAPDRGTKPKHEQERQPAIPDRATKPSSASSLYNSSSGLRKMVVPAMAMGKFLSVAQANTSANRETCAILAGRLSRDCFRITHLLVPKQTGTSDSCTTSNEEAIFDYMDKHELIMLGWIHTHPSQTAFLSSVDLHTHASYQVSKHSSLLC